MKYVVRSHKDHVGLRNETPVSVKRMFLALAERSYTSVWREASIKNKTGRAILTVHVAETLKHTARSDDAERYRNETSLGAPQ